MSWTVTVCIIKIAKLDCSDRTSARDKNLYAKSTEEYKYDL
jgi:hypothetical protein